MRAVDRQVGRLPEGADRALKPPTPSSGDKPQSGPTTPSGWRSHSPGPPELVAVDHHTLVEFENTTEARHLAQLEADAELVQRAMWADYEGKDWEAIARVLVGYGLLVMAAWTRSGRVYAECAAKGYRLERSPWIRDRETADDLATDCVVIALQKFRDTVLVPGKWNPNRGATLKTYFIGQCVIRYPNVYRSWLAQAKARAAIKTTEWPADDSPLPNGHGTSRDPATRAAHHAYAQQLMRGLDKQTRWIIYYRAVEDLSWGDVAELTGLSVSQAKSRLHRVQHRLDQGEQSA
jgi:DNA-directed RNA polymerase specialized sigma24 family protein